MNRKIISLTENYLEYSPDMGLVSETVKQVGLLLLLQLSIVWLKSISNYVNNLKLSIRNKKTKVDGML